MVEKSCVVVLYLVSQQLAAVGGKNAAMAVASTKEHAGCSRLLLVEDGKLSVAARGGGGSCW